MKSARALVPGSLLAFALLLAGVARGQDKDKGKDKDKTKETKETKEETTEYYPLTKGTTWTYKANDKRFTVTVAGFDKVGDQNCARLETRDVSGAQKEGTPIATEHVAVKADGVYRFQFERIDA